METVLEVYAIKYRFNESEIYLYSSELSMYDKYTFDHFDTDNDAFLYIQKHPELIKTGEIVKVKITISTTIS